jgi:hypothetical protein
VLHKVSPEVVRWTIARFKWLVGTAECDEWLDYLKTLTNVQWLPDEMIVVVYGIENTSVSRRDCAKYLLR